MDLVLEVADEAVEVRKLSRQLIHSRPALAQIHRRMQSDLPPLHRPIGKHEQIADLLEFECRALDAGDLQLLAGRRQSAEFEASARAQVDAQLFRELVLGRDPRSITTRLERGNAVLTKR